MQHQEFESPEELQGTIKCFWHSSMDFGPEESAYEIMPDGYAEVTFHFGNACSISYNGTRHPLPSPVVMGLLDKPVLLHSTGRLDVIGIRCFPWTVFDLLGLPSGKGGVNIFEHPVAALQPALNKCIEAGRIDEAVALLKQYFIDARSQVSVDSILSKAGGAMRAARGTMPVRQVAAAANATVRTLERKFKQSSGHTVKDVSGLMRFQQVRNHLWRYPDASLAGLAHDLGYTDQAHLGKDFKRYSGTTPAAFARKAKKEKLDFVAFIQA